MAQQSDVKAHVRQKSFYELIPSPEAHDILVQVLICLCASSIELLDSNIF